MNTTKRVLAVIAFAGAALSFSGAAHADKIINNMNDVVETNRVKNPYGITYGDSVNPGQGNIINPQALTGVMWGVAGPTQATMAPPAPLGWPQSPEILTHAG
ncbi:hypothetical protein ACGFYZ_40980 [Streptomyces sp. NPDC048330]|uniref:hypothetical protein n=1 Tax=Streptomyces sp. NPDC048330 TaxID=3365533 RepID=UPI0037114101